MRLGIADHKAIRAFVNKEAFEGRKLSTDGRSLDGHWLGGSRIAEWTKDGIRFNDKGSKAADYVQKQVRYHAAPVQIANRDPSMTKRDTEGPHVDQNHAKRIAHAHVQREGVAHVVALRRGGYYYVVPKAKFRGRVNGYPARVVYTASPQPARDVKRRRRRTRRDDTAAYDRAFRSLSQQGKDYLQEFTAGDRRDDLVAAWKRVPDRDHRTLRFLTEDLRPNYERVESMVAHEYYGDDY